MHSSKTKYIDVYDIACWSLNAADPATECRVDISIAATKGRHRVLTHQQAQEEAEGESPSLDTHKT